MRRPLAERLRLTQARGWALVNLMTPARPASSPHRGRPGVGAFLLLCTLFSGMPMAMAAAPGPVPQPRLAYPTLPSGEIVLLNGEPHLRPLIPRDSRIAPRDFLLDDDGLPPLSPEQREAAADAQRLTQLSQNYRPAPAIWKIADRDTTIYLFGTIHILPPGFDWSSPALDRIVGESSALLLESVDEVRGPKAALPAPAPVGTSSVRPLIDRVSPDHRAKLIEFTRTLPPGSAAMFDGMQTWIASIAIGVVREIRAGEYPGPGADDALEARFRAGGKPVEAIENATQVMTSIAALPEPVQRAMLDQALDAPERSRADMRRTLHAWAKGEMGRTSPLTVDIDASRSSALAAPLLLDRNLAWTASLMRRLRVPGTILFAAGAGHFVGRGSVIDLLRQNGVKVTRVQ